MLNIWEQVYQQLQYKFNISLCACRTEWQFQNVAIIQHTDDCTANIHADFLLSHVQNYDWNMFDLNL